METVAALNRPRATPAFDPRNSWPDTWRSGKTQESKRQAIATAIFQLSKLRLEQQEKYTTVPAAGIDEIEFLRLNKR
jgi:hypothetical protein